MSIYALIANLDRHEFVRPNELGLRSEIRTIENVPGLFHVVMARLLVGPWAGCRVAIITDAGGLDQDIRMPSWDTLMGRKHGWTDIFPAVVQDLFERHHRVMDNLHGGRKQNLLVALDEHIENLRGILDEAKADAENGHEVDTVEQMGVSRELEKAVQIRDKLKRMPT